MNTQKIADVQWTKDYDQFKILEYNREINEGQIKKLITSIQENGFLLPLLVNQDNYVADGQHRLEAAKRLKFEVSYITLNIDFDVLPYIVSRVNECSKNWSLVNYFEMWLCLQKESYIYLDKLFKKFIRFDSFPLFSKFMILGGKAMENFKMGEFTITDSYKKRIEMDLNNFQEIINFNSLLKDFGFVFHQAVANLVLHPEYNHEKMIEKLKENAGSLAKCIDRVDYSIQLQTLYNKGLKKNKIRITKR